MNSNHQPSSPLTGPAVLFMIVSVLTVLRFAFKPIDELVTLVLLTIFNGAVTVLFAHFYVKFGPMVEIMGIRIHRQYLIAFPFGFFVGLLISLLASIF